MAKRHTYDNLAISLKQIMDEYNLDIDKVRHIVTDGGSNFCKVFRVFGRANFDEHCTIWGPNVDNAVSYEEEDVMIQNEEEASTSNQNEAEAFGDDGNFD